MNGNDRLSGKTECWSSILSQVEESNSRYLGMYRHMVSKVGPDSVRSRQDLTDCKRGMSSEKVGTIAFRHVMPTGFYPCA